MSFADMDDFRVHYSLTGRPGAPVLVLSNSLGTNYSMWSPQVAEFERHFRLLRYDTRGHGQTAVTPGPCRISQLARDVLRLLDHLAIPVADFCGLSMGGMIGMWLGINAPMRLRRLILCGTAAKIGTEETWNARIETVRGQGMKSVAPGVMQRWFTQAFRERESATLAEFQRMLEATSPAGYASCCAAVRDMDERHAIASIHVPTLVIAGKHDPVTPPDDAQFLVEQIAGAQYCELDAAHLSNVEAAASFTGEVCRFLAS